MEAEISSSSILKSSKKLDVPLLFLLWTHTSWREFGRSYDCTKVFEEINLYLNDSMLFTKCLRMVQIPSLSSRAASGGLRGLHQPFCSREG
jgi:hypothetical protein